VSIGLGSCPVNAGNVVEEGTDYQCFVPSSGGMGLLPREEGSDSPVKCLNNTLRGAQRDNLNLTYG